MLGIAAFGMDHNAMNTTYEYSSQVHRGRLPQYVLHEVTYWLEHGLDRKTQVWLQRPDYDALMAAGWKDGRPLWFICVEQTNYRDWPTERALESARVHGSWLLERETL